MSFQIFTRLRIAQSHENRVFAYRNSGGRGGWVPGTDRADLRQIERGDGAIRARGRLPLARRFRIFTAIWSPFFMFPNQKTCFSLRQVSLALSLAIFLSSAALSAWPQSASQAPT